MNHSMIFMGMFEEAFSDIADKMTQALSMSSAALAGALAGEKAGDQVEKKLKAELAPQVRSQIGDLFSGIREEMSTQWPKNPKVFEKYISNATFDKGIEIVERYDFGRPRLTEKLSDEVLASYVFLIKSGDEQIARMFKELTEWQSGLPKPPWNT